MISACVEVSNHLLQAKESHLVTFEFKSASLSLSSGSKTQLNCFKEPVSLTEAEFILVR